MPRIFDNIENTLLPALQGTLEVAERGDFCVGYFNLRGWRHLAGHVGRWAGGEDRCCQIRVGIDDRRLAELVRNLREDGRLCVIDTQESQREPKLICSMGLNWLQN